MVGSIYSVMVNVIIAEVFIMVTALFLGLIIVFIVAYYKTIKMAKRKLRMQTREPRNHEDDYRYLCARLKSYEDTFPLKV